MTSGSFDNLPTPYLSLLQVAQDGHQLDVTPLQELKGGRSGAFLYLASVS